MSTTLPGDASKANCDSSTDDPKLALLTDLAGLVDKFNLLKAALGALAQMGFGNGLELEVSGGAAADLLRLASKETALTATTTLTATHRGRFISCTNTITLNLTAAGTLGDGWFCFVRNAGSGTVTIDPSASELVNGASTLALAAGESAILFCNGSVYKTVGYSPALTSAQVVTALGYTPSVNTHNHDGSYSAIGHNHSGVYVAADNGHDNVGSLCWAGGQDTNGTTPGATVAGSALKATGMVDNGTGALTLSVSATTLTGTWRCLGHSVGAGTGSGTEATLFQRIS